MITGEKSIRFQFGDQLDVETYRQVMRFSKLVEQDGYHLLEEIVPSYHTVTIYFKKEIQNTDEIVEHYLKKWRKTVGTAKKQGVRKLLIPVCYDETFSLDMERVMNHTKLTAKEIIRRHSQPIYTVFMIGFLPGFPYLGRMDEKLTTPRMATPRTNVSKGSVGIGGHQTGIYPIDSPGGWNMIGKTPLDLFRVDRREPFLLRAGDRLQFVSIPMSEYYEMEKTMELHPEVIDEFVHTEMDE